MPEKFERETPTQAEPAVQEQSWQSSKPVETMTGDDVIQQSLGEKLFNDYANLVDGEGSFDAMDADDDGFLNRSEVRSTDVGKRIFKDYYKTQQASDDQYGSDYQGISHNDLEERFKQSLDNAIIESGNIEIDRAGVRISARTHGDNGLCSLELEDSKRQIELDYHHGELGITRGDANSNQFDTSGLTSEQRDRGMMETDLALGGVLGEELKKAYVMDAEARRSGVFWSVDDDKDGYMTRSELKKFISESGQSNRISDARMHDAAEDMLSEFEVLQASSNDEMFFENSGITMKDLSQNLINAASHTDVHARIENRLDSAAPGRRYHGPDGYECIDGETGVKTTFSGGTNTIEIIDPYRNQVVQLGQGETFTVKYSNMYE